MWGMDQKHLRLARTKINTCKQKLIDKERKGHGQCWVIHRHKLGIWTKITKTGTMIEYGFGSFERDGASKKI